MSPLGVRLYLLHSLWQLQFIDLGSDLPHKMLSSLLELVPPEDSPPFLGTS